MFTLINNKTELAPDKLRYLINTDTGETFIDVDSGGGEFIRRPLSVDYTAFEVYAHDSRIEAGELDPQSHSEFIGKPGDVITFPVNPSMTEEFILRSEQSPELQDVLVDWGDGRYTYVKDVTYTQSAGEYRYKLTHEYETTGTYIIKILGTTYFSFSSSGSVDTSLICRVFEPDLPIARHVFNLSSAFQHANRLLHVNMYSHPAAYQVTHWSGAFTSSRNLIDCVGFSKYSHRESNYNIFQNCIGLVTTDLRIAPSPADKSTGNAYAFTSCSKLAVDINNILPVHSFGSGGKINVARLFKGCISLTGAVPGDKLWGDKSISWLNTSETFAGCSDDIRAQVPVSWGGTNTSIDNELSITPEMLEDYSAFEVYAHDTDIPVGDNEVLGGYVTKPISASMTCMFVIRSHQSPEQQNILIAWGDGAVTTTSDCLADLNSSDDEYTCLVSHEYKAAGKYTVKIFGSDYFNFCSLGGYSAWRSAYANNILTCRILANDLPIASHIKNLSSIAHSCNRLLKVSLGYKIDLNGKYLVYAFRNCENLLEVSGFWTVTDPASVQYMFNGCVSLKESDFVVPAAASVNITGVYGICNSLATPIENLIPTAGFTGKRVDVDTLFANCKKITGTIPAKLLWDDKSVEWINTSKVFKGCAAAVRSQAPLSWGGTASDDIIKPSIEARLKALEELLEQKSAVIAALEESLNGSSIKVI